MAVNQEIKEKNIINRFIRIPVKSFGSNRLYKGLGFEVKELYNINSICSINKHKAISSRVGKGSCNMSLRP